MATVGWHQQPAIQRSNRWGPGSGVWLDLTGDWEMSAIHDLTDKIRSLVNEQRKSYALRQKADLWSQLASSLDTIGDCEMAVSAYVGRDVGAARGAQYLAVYGLLQALFLQQDAALHLCEPLGVDTRLDDYPKLKVIRDIRNASIGHPTRKDRPKSQPTAYYFISQSSLTLDGFNLLSWDANGVFECRWISISELIGNQKEGISQILALAVVHLENERAVHKEKFRTERLASVFPSTLDYHFAKVLEGIEKGELQFARINLQPIEGVLQSFRDALRKRGIELETYDPIKYLYDELEYPLTRLVGYLGEGETDRGLGKKDAHIFVFFVEKRVDELRQIAQRIDQDYAE